MAMTSDFLTAQDLHVWHFVQQVHLPETGI